MSPFPIPFFNPDIPLEMMTHLDMIVVQGTDKNIHVYNSVWFKIWTISEKSKKKNSSSNSIKVLWQRSDEGVKSILHDIQNIQKNKKIIIHLLSEKDFLTICNFSPKWILRKIGIFGMQQIFWEIYILSRW